MRVLICPLVSRTGRLTGRLTNLLIGKWLIVGMVIAPIEQVALYKLISVIFVYLYNACERRKAEKNPKKNLPGESRSLSPVEGAPTSTCCSHFIKGILIRCQLSFSCSFQKHKNVFLESSACSVVFDVA